MPIDTDDLFRTDESGHLLEALQADHIADALDIGIEPERAAQEASESALWFPHSPFLLPLSGIYHRRRPDLPIFIGDQLRLDVDGALPQMAASGLRRSPFYRTVHWVANLTRVGTNTWEGAIIYREGDTSLLPHSTVRIQAWRFGLFSARRAAVTFSGPGLPSFTHVYYFTSAYFDRVEFEFDSTSDAHPQYQIDTGAHPTRPTDLPIENLDAEKVFRRAGFDVQISSGASTVPIADAGIDGVWSDTEMHDAMQAHWSRFSNSPYWGMWVFTAALHEDTSEYDGDDLGGIMFDSVPGMEPHRQGTAIFSESFIKDAPAGESAPDAFVQRTRFWTMIHEMGHAFNLAHSWQKSHPPSWGTPWIPLTNEPEARSFMNYPRRVSGGETAFYSTFRYRFSNPELLFMRHAPRRFVQMANADWFDHHGFQNAMTSPEPRFALALRVNKAQPVLEFLEPAMIELKLTNVSGDPLVIDRQILSEADDLTLIVKRDGHPAKMWRPFAHRCLRSRSTVLAAGESMYQSLFTGVGLDGWLVAEPGWYTVQACLRIADAEDVVSKPLRLRVLPARGYEEETLAQDFFSDAVGRVLAFDGARDPSLQQANDVLREVTERWPRHCVTPHAAVALAMPLRRAGKVVTSNDRGKRITAVPAQLDEAQRLLRATLVENSDASAATLGHIDFRDYGQALARTLASSGRVSAAREVATKVTNTLAHRQVKPSVLTEMKAFTEALPHSNSGGRNTHPRKGRK